MGTSFGFLTANRFPGGKVCGISRDTCGYRDIARNNAIMRSCAWNLAYFRVLYVFTRKYAISRYSAHCALASINTYVCSKTLVSRVVQRDTCSANNVMRTANAMTKLLSINIAKVMRESCNIGDRMAMYIYYFV